MFPPPLRRHLVTSEDIFGRPTGAGGTGISLEAGRAASKHVRITRNKNMTQTVLVLRL